MKLLFFYFLFFTISYCQILSRNNKKIMFSKDAKYVCAYFISYYEDGGIQDTIYENSLKIAFSKYGKKDWYSVGDVYTVNHNFRDPNIIKHKDKYYIAYTRNAFVEGTNVFSVIDSKDLINWDSLNTYSVSITGVNTLRVWVASWLVEDQTTYLSICVKTSDNNKFQLYLLKVLDWVNLTFDKPMEITVTGKDNIIDGDFKKIGNFYYVFYKNLNTSYLELAKSNSLNGTYTEIALNFPNWTYYASGAFDVEGADIHLPGFYRNNDKYILFGDYGGSTETGGATKAFMGWVESSDLINWTKVKPFNIQMIGGSILRIK